jgi:hypothetical protein
VEADVDEEIQRAMTAAAEMAEIHHLQTKISANLDSMIQDRAHLIQLKNKHMSEDEASAAAHGSLLYQYKNI